MDACKSRYKNGYSQTFMRKSAKRTNIRFFSVLICRKYLRCIRLGETAGEKGTFCRGKGEFLPGKLELRGRAQ